MSCLISPLIQHKRARPNLSKFMEKKCLLLKFFVFDKGSEKYPYCSTSIATVKVKIGRASCSSINFHRPEGKKPLRKLVTTDGTILSVMGEIRWDNGAALLSKETLRAFNCRV